MKPNPMWGKMSTCLSDCFSLFIGKSQREFLLYVQRNLFVNLSTQKKKDHRFISGQVVLVARGFEQHSSHVVKFNELMFHLTNTETLVWPVVS